MRTFARIVTPGWILLALGSAFSPLAGAAVFTIDASQSYLRIVPGVFDATDKVVGGTKFAKNFAIGAQSPGSLQTALEGELHAAVIGSSLEFSGGSRIVAKVNEAAPLFPSSGDTGSSGGVEAYGGTALFAPGFSNGDLAIRGAEVDIATGSATIGSAAGALQFVMSRGILDYEIIFPPTIGFENLPDVLPAVLNTATAPMSGDVGGVIDIPLFLSYPFSLFDFEDSVLELEGRLVATRVGASLAGDFNGDQHVNSADLRDWESRFGVSGGADGAEFLLWQRHVENRATTRVVATSVPEPSICLMAIASMVWRLSRRRAE